MSTGNCICRGWHYHGISEHPDICGRFIYTARCVWLDPRGTVVDLLAHTVFRYYYSSCGCCLPALFNRLWFTVIRPGDVQRPGLR